MMEFREPGWSVSAGFSTAGAGVGLGSGSGSGSCFLLPLTLMTVSTVACEPMGQCISSRSAMST